MKEIGEISVQKRRSRQEIKRLVAVFETSGQRRSIVRNNLPEAFVVADQVDMALGILFEQPPVLRPGITVLRS
jgi:hypothetical protein